MAQSARDVTISLQKIWRAGALGGTAIELQLMI
jgi:hypothetical protein